MVQLGIPRASRREYAAPSPRSSVSRRRRRGARSGHSGTFGESCEQRSRAEQRSPQDNPEWRSSDPSALRNPNSVALYAVLHQRVKCVARRNSHGYPKSLRNLLFDLHEAKHVRNFRRWVVVNEEIEVAVGSFSPNGPAAEYEKTRRAVLAQSGVVGPQDLDQSGSVHRFNIATIGVARRDTLGRRTPSGRSAGLSTVLDDLCSFLHQRELQQDGALNGGEVVVRDQREHGVAGSRAVYRQPFHVVDLVAHVGEHHGRAVDERAGLDGSQGDTPDAQRDAAPQRIAPLENQELAGEQQRTIADVTADTAFRLAKALGTTAQLWLNLQND